LRGAGCPRVTHPFATVLTPKGFLVRLACLKHTVSVRPEPRSNSPNYTALAPEGAFSTCWCGRYPLDGPRLHSGTAKSQSRRLDGFSTQSFTAIQFSRPQAPASRRSRRILPRKGD